jgi:hypothetical protein
LKVFFFFDRLVIVEFCSILGSNFLPEKKKTFTKQAIAMASLIGSPRRLILASLLVVLLSKKFLSSARGVTGIT